MSLPNANLLLPAPLIGVGIDVCDGARFCGVRERWGGRVDRVFSSQELQRFPGAELGWAWAAREAIVKALKTRMLGSPLAHMIVAWTPSGLLQYRPGAPARDQLRRHGVDTIALHHGTLSGRQCVIALAFAAQHTSNWRLSWAALPFGDRSEASGRARDAGRLACRSLLGPTVARNIRWSGGHGAPPFLDTAANASLQVSLSHDGGVAAAVVAARLPQDEAQTRSSDVSDEASP